ncbi:MAG: GNAT family N-acetyltransferase [Candidatus Obscuribacterales bacterium]|nr:GNAT family N-acetyltransferase [Candidatus Obscuribacterales bacterium]
MIRLMKKQDLYELAAVYVQALDHANTNEKWTEQSAYALLSDWFKRQPDLAFVAELDHKLVGAFIVGVRPWWDGNHLVDGELFVDHKYQGRGIARELIRQTLITAIEKYAPVSWESYTFRAQEFPLTWYKRMGFKEIEEWIMIRADVAELMINLQTII